MKPVAMTGADGFLGWHTRVALLEQGNGASHIPVGEGFDLEQATATVDGSPRLIHLAGVNRGSDDEVADGNVLFAEQMAQALRGAAKPPPVVVYANSIQATNGSVYGDAKLCAAEILASASAEVGAEFVDVRFPNLFGEHGRPFYNAVTATFCYLLADSQTPEVHQDRELALLHAQNAADLLTGAVGLSEMARLVERESVSGLLKRLSAISETYRRGDIPDVATDFDRDLFNTYRSYVIDTQTPIDLTRHADDRGSFFEIIRSHGGCGQSSFSTTVPGISRGDHFHRRKIERFTVLSGEATISLRRLFTDEVREYAVNGTRPAAVDMPTGWSHKIENTGQDLLYTSFWTNELFDPSSPDTIPEAV